MFVNRIRFENGTMFDSTQPLRTLTLMATPHGPAAEPSPDPHARVPPREPQDGSPAPRTRGASTRAGGRRRASLSVESIVDTAIAMLDRDGAARLTLRGLAAELRSGVASLYWYASGKDELMAMVADEVLGRALAQFETLRAAGQSAPEQFAQLRAPEPDPRTSARTREALVDLRRLSLCLFAQMLEHLWLAEQLVHAGPDEENALRTWECTGQILQRMELSTSQQFHASMAVSNYASGMGAEISQRQAQRHEQDAEQMFREQLERWDHASAQDFPFLHSVLGEFRRHDDRAEYAAGLDLLLSGIERQTWAGRPAR